MKKIHLLNNRTPHRLIACLERVFKMQVAPAVISVLQYKNWCTAGNHLLIVVIFAALFVTSCKKDNLTNTVFNNTASASSSAQANAGVASPNTGYGAFIRPPRNTDKLSFELKVADQVGISCLRTVVIVPSQGDSLVPELNTNYKVLLNFSSAGSGQYKGLPFRTDTKQYKIDLNNILNTFTVMPIVAVIENEESNRFFYSGYAFEYIIQLKAAINVMHARNIKVANGAITKPGLCYLVYQDFLAQGKKDSARKFKNLVHLNTYDTATQQRSLFIDTLLTNYATMNLDYVNFHWKDSVTNTDALNEVINYLVKRTSKTIICNELGQFDSDPNTLIALVQRCTDRNFPFIIWYSPDKKYQNPEYPLQFSDATLTPTGIAYRDYLAN